MSLGFGVSASLGHDVVSIFWRASIFCSELPLREAEWGENDGELLVYGGTATP